MSAVVEWHFTLDGDEKTMTGMQIVDAILSDPSLSRSDLQRISAALRDRFKMQEQRAKHQFSVNDVVEFDSSRRSVTVKGTIVKIAKSTIHVRERSVAMDMVWHVSPSLLRKV